MYFEFYSNLKHILTHEMIVIFLYEHLDRFRDSKEDIKKCLDYVFSKEESEGGFILCALEDDKLLGVVVIIETGMIGYIPENFLVYIAVDAENRGQGIGSKLIKQAIDKAKGDVALHVEFDNPAKKLYEHLGFTSKYAEMRFKK